MQLALASRVKSLCRLSFRLGPGQIALVFVVTFMASAFEIVGVGMIYAFAGLIFDPEQTQQILGNEFLQEKIMGPSQSESLVYIGLGIILFFFIKCLIGFAGIALRFRFGGRLAANVGQHLMRLYAEQPYEKIIQKHSSSMLKNTLSECLILGNSVVTPFVGILADSMFLLLMFGFLLWMEPTTTLLAAGFFSVGYVLIYFVVKPLTDQAGRDRPYFAQGRTKAAVEFFGGLRDIIISGRAQNYLAKFGDANSAFIGKENRLHALPAAPSFGIQFLAMSSIVIVILLYHLENKTAGNMVASITLFGAAGLRMMPALNSLVREVLTLRGHWTSYLELMAEIERLERDRQPRAAASEAIEVKDLIALRDVSFRYPDTKSAAVQNMTIEVKRGSSVGIVGSTGAGKSTTVEIFLGLLRPQQGFLEVDGRPLEQGDMASWQASLGYVPQQVFLADDSVARNIAFGLGDDDIDQAQVEEAARLAQIDNFVRDELAQGFETHVGERGTRLSGGQIQRIGIARALYNDPEVLILDEATSALDSLHEDLINQAVRSLKGKVTTIVIAHRLSTIRHCDQIYVLGNGEVVGCGSYEELERDSPEFKKLSAGVGAITPNH